MLLNCGVGEDFESILDYKNIQPVYHKGDLYWVFIGRTDVEAEIPILWPPDAKSWLIGKDPDTGKDRAGERDNRGWDGWMASLTQWTWVWANSRTGVGDGQGGLGKLQDRSWWWTGRPGQTPGQELVMDREAWANWGSWGSRVRHELNWSLVTKPWFSHRFNNLRKLKVRIKFQFKRTSCLKLF